MQFDEAKYKAFLTAHRTAKTNPDDLLERYAITLPASDGDIKAQVEAVRAYWNKISLGSAGISRIAKWCRDQDEELRKQAGVSLESARWWKDAEDAAARKSAGAIRDLAERLKQAYGTLGVVTAPALGKAGSLAGLSAAEAERAARQAGLQVIDEKVKLPDAPPLAPTVMRELARNLVDCHVASIPELLHPGSGKFRIVARYECVSDAAKRLDLAAIDSQIAEAGKSKGAVNTTKADALRKLRDAQTRNIDLREVTLSHLMLVVEDTPAIMAKGELEKRGVEATDAATIAALLEGRQKATKESAVDKVRGLLENGELREADNIAASLSGDEAAEVQQKVAARKQELASLLAQADAAQQAGHEPQAEQLLRDAARISREDAEPKLARLPLAPAAQVRATGDDATVRLFWERGPGHDAGTVYVVTRTVGRAPSAPADGAQVHRGSQVECADPDSPVGSEVQYGVFALADGRPPSRVVTVAVTALPPVWDLRAETGIGAITLSWRARAEAEVRVTRAAAGAAPAAVPVAGNSVRLTGLPDGVAQRFEVVALYRGAGGAELPSLPKHVIATPRGEAKPNLTLRVTTTLAGDQIQVHATWKRIDSSRVAILRSDGMPPWPEGEVITAEQAERAGTIMTGHVEEAGTDCGMDFALPGGIHYLTALSEGGAGTAVGKTRPVAIIAPVTEVVATPFAEYATISWRWPASVQLAEVSWQLGDDDQSADHVQLSLAEYQAKGGARVPLGAQPCRVEVRALVTVGAKRHPSPPASVTVERVLKTPIRYRVSGAPFSRAKKLTFTADAPCAGVLVRVIAASGSIMPTRPGDGVTILETTLNLAPGVAAEHKAEVPKSFKKPYWVRCFLAGGPGRLIDPPIGDLKEG